MTEQLAAFSGEYSDWRIVKRRKCIIVSFEVPIEAAHHAYQVLGGMPNPAESVYFAIARLKNPEQ